MNSRLDSNNISKLLGSLLTCTKLKFLNLGYNKLEGTSIIYLSEIIKNLIGLETLALSYCKIGSKQISLIIKSLENHNNLKKLYLNANYLHDSFCVRLCNNTEQFLLLESLDVSKNQITSKGAEFLGKFLFEKKYFKQLWISDTEIELEGLKHIMYPLKYKNILDVLDLKNIIHEDISNAASTLEVMLEKLLIFNLNIERN